MRLILAPVAMLALAGCEVETKSPVTGEDKVAVKAGADGRVAFDLPFAKGEVKLPAEMMQASNFDIGGVSLMPGATVTGFNIDAGQGGPDKVNLTFTAPSAPQVVSAWFADQFAAKQVAVQQAANALTGVTRDGASFRMTFDPQGSGTLGRIEVGPPPPR